MIDEELRRAAELEMGRVAPDSASYPKNKRRKTGHEGGEGEYRTVQYEYSAAEPLLRGSPGFLVTCDFRREKSAIKEVLPVLDKYVEKAKADVQAPASAGGSADPAEGSDQAVATGQEPAFLLTPVRLALRGAMFLRLRTMKGDEEVVDGRFACGIASRAIHRLITEVEQGAQPRLKFCYRITPVELSCKMEQAAIEAAVTHCSQLFLKHWAKDRSAASNEALPRLTYAVRFQAKGSDSKGKPAATSSASGGTAELPLKREDMIKAMAATLASACEGIAEPGADLKSPKVACIAEGMPLASGEAICAVCVVDSTICVTKPSLRLKSISAETK